MSDPEGPASILIVDDKPEKLLALEAVLEDLDQNIVCAYSGREALRHLLTHEFAVILLDVNMPGMDGFEAAAMIRQRPSSQHIPIIFITAFGDDMHMARGYSLGAVDYIQTPVVPDVLRSKVSVFVELYQKTAQVRRQSESLRRRASQLQKLSASSLAINSAISIDQMLQTVTDCARDMIGCHQCITLFLSDAHLALRPTRIRAAASFSDKYSAWRNKRLEVDALATTIIAQGAVATRLTEAELREHPDWETIRMLDIPRIRGGMMAAPLSGRNGKNLGLIFLAERTEGDFSDDDIALLIQMAQMTSIAIQNSIFSEEREANRIKDEFLATLSHELRTPLNAIVGWTQLLRLEEMPAEATHGLDVIDRNVKAQTKLIEDLLDVSRITTGKMRLAVRTISLSPLIEAAIETVRPAADARNVQLNAELAEDVQVSGDPDRLQQVVWNLLSNAVKFSRSGGKVTASLDRLNSHAQIRVSDAGQGIDPTFLPFVFDRFRQADSTITRSYGGLGIGLTIVRHIVELHGGTVAAHSPGIDQGATFTLTLPTALLRETQPASELSPQQPEPVRYPTNFDGQLEGLRVLLVDDEADARELLGEILRRGKAKVVTAASVREAFESLSRCTPDVVISDIAMPGEDGYSFIQSLRQFPQERGGQTPAIALTAYAREEDRLRALSAGFQMHLSKPVEPAQLVAAVAHLARTRAASLAESAQPEPTQTSSVQR